MNIDCIQTIIDVGDDCTLLLHNVVLSEYFHCFKTRPWTALHFGSQLQTTFSNQDASCVVVMLSRLLIIQSRLYPLPVHYATYPLLPWLAIPTHSLCIVRQQYKAFTIHSITTVTVWNISVGHHTKHSWFQTPHSFSLKLSLPNISSDASPPLMSPL